MRREPIRGGYILLSRKLLKSGIMEQPPLYLKLWLWMLMQASFKDHGSLKRGQFFTSLEKMRESMSYKSGYRLAKPTVKEIRGVTKFLTKVRMIVTTKVTHGMVITILNYDYYQTPENYEGHTICYESPHEGPYEGHRGKAGEVCQTRLYGHSESNEGQTEGHIEGTILRRKDKEGKNPRDFFSLRQRYSDQKLIDQVFTALASTRKSGKVTDSVLLAQLKKWERHPVAQVEGGIRIYLDKGYADQGKREEYLFGIIRRLKVVAEPEQQSSGSKLLDDYYARSGN